MSDMSYCMFRNTLADLRDCYEAMDDDDLSDEESTARLNLVALCFRIINEYGDEYGFTD